MVTLIRETNGLFITTSTNNKNVNFWDVSLEGALKTVSELIK